MGISGFFKWLTDQYHYPNIVNYCIEYEAYYDEHGVLHSVDETQQNPNGIEFDNLYLDMNDIIHTSARTNNQSKFKNENEVIQAIFDCIDRIFAIVRPRKLLYIAIDGVSPRAKLHKQRSGRVLEPQIEINTTREMEIKKNEIIASGKFLPSTENKQETIGSFDKHTITCGTAFMLHLSNCLQYYIYQRMNSKPAWRSIQVILSDANVPGEGEHKIMNFIRQYRRLSNDDRQTCHVIYGTDADLILLGIATHEQYVIIMREQFVLPPCELCQQLGHSFRKCQGISRENLGQSTASTSHPTKNNYIFVNLLTLREQLLDTPWKNERFLDDWVFICLMIGNDFLPGIPSFEIHENAIDILMEIYSDYLSTMNDYLTNNGKLNIKFFKTILLEFGKTEDDIFQRRQKINEGRSNKNQPMQIQVKSSFNREELIAQNQTPILSFRPASFSRSTASSTIKSTEIASSSLPSNVQQTNPVKTKLPDSSISNHSEGNQIPEDNIRLGEEGWRERYYENKFRINHNHVEERCRTVVQDYARGLQWVLQYYYHGVPSWDWYYPHHYAPFASDFLHLFPMSVQFNEQSQPFKPLEQLICLLPRQCPQYLPQKWQSLISSEISPIIDFYPLNFTIDSNGKRYESQYTVLLPFVNETRLHTVLEKYYPLLTSDEAKRNEINNDLLFIHVENSHYRLLEERLNIGNEPKTTAANQIQIPTTIERIGHVWQNDQTTPTGQSIRSPLQNYNDICKNRVLCVNYRC